MTAALEPTALHNLGSVRAKALAASLLLSEGCGLRMASRKRGLSHRLLRNWRASSPGCMESSSIG